MTTTMNMTQLARALVEQDKRQCQEIASLKSEVNRLKGRQGVLHRGLMDEVNRREKIKAREAVKDREIADLKKAALDISLTDERSKMVQEIKTLESALSDALLRQSPKKKAKKAKKVKKVKKPRKLTAYNAYMKENLTKVKQEFPDIDQQDVLTIAANRWSKDKQEFTKNWTPSPIVTVLSTGPAVGGSINRPTGYRRHDSDFSDSDSSSDEE